MDTPKSAGVNVSITLNESEKQALKSKLQPKRLVGDPFRTVLRKAVLQFQKPVAEATPVQTGRLRGSIADASKAIQIDKSAVPKWGQLSTNVNYATSVEYGGTYKGKYIGPRHVVESTPLAAYASGTTGAMGDTKHRRIFGKGPFLYGYEQTKGKALEPLREFGSLVDRIWRKG